MVKFAIFVCALFVFCYTEVRCQETLETLQEKVADLEVKSESDVTAARNKVVETLNLLRQKSLEYLSPTVNSVGRAVVQFNQQIDALKNGTGERDITECLAIQNNVHNASLSLIGGVYECLLRKTNQASEFSRESDRYREEAQTAIADLKVEVERCRIQEIPGCLSCVNEMYEAVSNVRVPELLQHITERERMISSITPSLSECTPPADSVSNFIQSTEPALERFRECVQNA